MYCGKEIFLVLQTEIYSYPWYWGGTSVGRRQMLRNKSESFASEKIPPHLPSMQASSIIEKIQHFIINLWFICQCWK